MNAEQRIVFFQELKANNPKPSTELEYSSPFELLTAVLLSAQATDISVNKGTRRLFAVANTPEAILTLGEAGVRPYIQHIGLYKTKGKHLQETCSILINRHGAEVPKKREDLEALPGYCRVIWNRHVAEMSDLSRVEREILMALVDVTEFAVRRVMHPQKINIASLGNQVPHLHWHVIPRFIDDPFFPGSIWSSKQRELSESIRKTRREASRSLPDAIRSGIADLA